jgi:hypothetical protein
MKAKFLLLALICATANAQDLFFEIQARGVSSPGLMIISNISNSGSSFCRARVTQFSQELKSFDVKPTTKFVQRVSERCDVSFLKAWGFELRNCMHEKEVLSMILQSLDYGEKLGLSKLEISAVSCSKFDGEVKIDLLEGNVLIAKTDVFRSNVAQVKLIRATGDAFVGWKKNQITTNTFHHKLNKIRRTTHPDFSLELEREDPNWFQVWPKSARDTK